MGMPCPGSAAARETAWPRLRCKRSGRPVRARRVWLPALPVIRHSAGVPGRSGPRPRARSTDRGSGSRTRAGRLGSVRSASTPAPSAPNSPPVQSQSAPAEQTACPGSETVSWTGLPIAAPMASSEARQTTVGSSALFMITSQGRSTV